MGYRSDVTIAMTVDAQKKFEVALAAADEKTKNEVKELLALADYNRITKYGWLLVFTGVKWYNDCKECIDVRFIEDFLNHEDSSSYLYYRIGEELDDIELQGDWLANPYEVYLYRHIDFDLLEEEDEEE